MNNQLLALIAGILTTLLETGGAPASSLYLAVNMNMRLWESMRDLMLKAEWIEISNHYVTLTEKGKAKAEEINKAMSAPKKVQNLAM